VIAAGTADAHGGGFGGGGSHGGAFTVAVSVAAGFATAAFAVAVSVAAGFATAAFAVTGFGLEGFSAALIPATTITAHAIGPYTGPPIVTDHGTGVAREIVVPGQSLVSWPVAGAQARRTRPCVISAPFSESVFTRTAARNAVQ
jgi:hypothetical protein